MLNVATQSKGRWITFSLRNGKELAGRLEDVALDATSAYGPLVMIKNKDGVGYIRLEDVAGMFVADERTP